MSNRLKRAIAIAAAATLALGLGACEGDDRGPIGDDIGPDPVENTFPAP